LLEIEGRYSFACGSERISLNWWEKGWDKIHGKRGFFFFSACVCQSRDFILESKWWHLKNK
jgi:hypothetical protein